MNSFYLINKVTPHSLVEFKPEFITKIILHRFGYDHVRDDYNVIQIGMFI